MDSFDPPDTPQPKKKKKNKDNGNVSDPLLHIRWSFTIFEEKSCVFI